MNPLFFILGIVILSQLSLQKTSSNSPSIGMDAHLVTIQQDSTPPAKKGVVKVKTLENPKKKKVSKKTKNKQPKVKKSTPQKTTQTVVKTKEKASSPKPNKKKKNNHLSLEEEIKILAKTAPIELEDKIHPQQQENCTFAFDIIDEFTGVQKRGLAPRPFFSYTPEEYRKFIKEGDFIRCEGFLSQSSGGNMALNINLYVASREAKHKFGAIKPNSALVLRSMNGKDFFLMTYKGAEPQVVDNMTYYQCSFAINKPDLKHLQKTEIDQVKISFQKGFQSYDVFYLDFIIDQFPCFD